MTFPAPEPGLVISYSFLWSDEAAAGRAEGSKTRPCALRMPPKVCRHLGLDDEPTWIVIDEINEFTWPGYDLRPVPGRPSQYSYGFLPPRLLAEILERMLALRARRLLDFVSR